MVQVALRDSLDLRASAGVLRGVPSLCAVLVSLSSRCLARGSQTRRNRSTRCCTPRAILCVDAPAISSPLGTTTRAGSGLVRKRVAACKDVGLGAAWEGEGAAGADCGCGQVCKGVYVCNVSQFFFFRAYEEAGEIETAVVQAADAGEKAVRFNFQKLTTN